MRAHHLPEEQLLDSYFAERAGGTPDPPVAEHLVDCDECGARYIELSAFLDDVRAEADSESESVFTAERLRAQQLQIGRRLELMARPARVITFPKQLERARLAPSTHRSARRWLAAAVAAGVCAAVGGSLVFEALGSRETRTARYRTVSGPVRLTPIAPESSNPQPEVSDDAFLTEVEVAVERPHTRELQAFDALTPHVREVANRIR